MKLSAFLLLGSLAANALFAGYYFTRPDSAFASPAPQTKRTTDQLWAAQKEFEPHHQEAIARVTPLLGATRNLEA